MPLVPRTASPVARTADATHSLLDPSFSAPLSASLSSSLSASPSEAPMASAEPSSLELASLFAFTINYIFGAGVLGVPYALVHGGLVASSLLLVAASALALASMVWILEVQERANALLDQDALVEYSQLCGMFLGQRWRRVADVALSLYVVSSAWMYCAILSISLSSAMPLFADAGACDLSAHHGPLWGAANRACWLDYCVYLGAFAAIMVFVVRLDIAKMQSLQLLMTGFGFTALFVMIGTVAAATGADGIAPIDGPTEVFNGVSFGAVFGTFIFAQLAHQGVPLLSYIPQKEKRAMVPKVLASVIATTTVLYLLLGILCGLYFGVHTHEGVRPVNKLITLNWQDYGTNWGPHSAFSTAISLFVRIYPAITCGAAFPLYVITLGNAWKKTWDTSKASASASENASASLESELADSLGQSLLANEGEMVDSREESKNWWYLVAMVPPVFLAALMADISFMLLLVGVCAILIAFIIPPLMQLKSIQAQGIETKFQSHFSKPVYCYVCLVFGTVAFIYTFISQVL